LSGPKVLALATPGPSQKAGTRDIAAAMMPMTVTRLSEDLFRVLDLVAV
jgi:hypothetical protein